MARLQRSLGLGALCVLVAVLASPTQLSGVVAHPAPVGGAVSDPAGPSHTAVVQGASASASSSAHEMNPSVSSPSESVAVGNGMNALASRYDTVMAETINALLEFYDQPGDEAPSLDHLQELALQWNPELRQLQEQIAATSIDQPSESIAASSNPHAVERNELIERTNRFYSEINSPPIPESIPAQRGERFWTLVNEWKRNWLNKKGNFLYEV